MNTEPTWWEPLCEAMAGGMHQYDYWWEVPQWTIDKFLKENT